ncbi:MAG: right-handed parallel beta-helix repeat-containing protein [Planctomycetota bacterium JB042]
MIASFFLAEVVGVFVLTGTAQCVDPPELVRVGPTRPITTVAGGLVQAATIAPTLPAGVVPKVLVDPGTYTENVAFPTGVDLVLEGRPLTPCDVVLDGSGAPQPVVRVAGGQTAATVIRGFTVTGGSGAGAGTLGVGRWGGGFYVVNSSPTIEHNVVEENLVQEAGGGIYCRDSASYVHDNVFRRNVSEGRGGGVALESCDAVVAENCFVAEPSDCADWSEDYANLGLFFGGAISCGDGDASIVHANRIRGNRARMGGGIAVLEGSTSLLVGNEVLRNGIFDSIDFGGGIYVEDANPCLLSNVVAFNGDVDGQGCFAPLEGGGIYLEDSSAELIGNTIWGNRTEGSAFDDATGGGVAFRGFGTPVLRNNLIWGNVAHPSFGPNVYEGSFVSVTHDLNCIENGTHPFDFFTTNPGLIDPAGEDFHLKFGSPLKDAGSHLAGSCILSPFDFEGDPRVVGGGTDIGADEWSEHLYHVGPTVTPTGGGLLRMVGPPGRSAGVFYAALKLSPGYEVPAGVNGATWFLGFDLDPDCDFEGVVVETPAFLLYDDGGGVSKVLNADGYADFLLPPIGPLPCPFTLWFQGIQILPPNAKWVTNAEALKLE